MKPRLVTSSAMIAALLTLCVFSASAQITLPPQPIRILPANPVVSPGQTELFTALSVIPLTFGTVSTISAGEEHTCALIPNGTVQCWGLNGNGELGNGTTSDSSTPVTVNGLTGATAVGAGGGHSCALLNNGTVECWGANGWGQLGNGARADSYVPVAVIGLTGVTAIVAGYEDTCALLADGSVQCWGSNANSHTPVPAPGVGGGVLTGAIAIAGGAGQGGLGGGHMCALISDGTVDCWGDNTYGQLGNYGAGPFQVQNLSGAIAIAAGDAHSCALLSDGTVECWGWNSWGQLGNGTTTDSSSPQPVVGMTGRAIGITAGYGQTCALIDNGTVNCWGSDSSGELGNGTTTPAPAATTTPQIVNGLSGATAIAAGGSHSCALLVDGSVECWGDNFDGQLGNGSATGSNLPVTVAVNNLAAQGAVHLGIGEYASHTCALLANGTAECWGANGGDQLGNGNPPTQSSTPVAMTVLSGIKSLATGGVRTCALTADGIGWCWGLESYGELGIGNPNGSPTPAPLTQPQNVKYISAGGGFTCVLASDGTVWCAGANDQGELGVGEVGVGGNGNSTVPEEVRYSTGMVLSGVKAIATGADHACALIADGTVQCWGANFLGQLGTGVAPGPGVPVPMPVLGLSGATAIFAGGEYTCVRQANGSVLCWGWNAVGQLGDGVPDDSTTPVQVLLPTPAAAITAGEQDACAVAADGTTECWGYNGAGQLGNGTTANSSTPVPVQGLTGTVALTIGDHTCALSYNGGVECWGYGFYGQLGNGSTSDQHTPVATNPLVTPVVWTSTLPEIAAIDPASGLATAGSSNGTTTITATYGARSASTSLTVALPTPVITWPTPAAITYGTGLSSAQLSATADVPGGFAYTPLSGTVLPAGLQTLSLTFTPTDTSDYATATATVNLSVLAATPAVTVTGGNFTYDGTQHAATAAATGVNNAPVAGTFSFVYTPPGNATAPSAAGSYPVTANFISGDTNYSNNSGVGSISIAKVGSATSITSNSPNPALPGQMVTVSFQVTGATVPTGTVTVTASTSETCSAALNAGTGSCGIAFATTGTRTLTAVYSGDPNFNGSSSRVVGQSVTGPIASVSPTSVNFNTVYSGSITTKSITLTNSGTTAMTVTGPILSIVKGGDSDEFVEVNLCPKSLAAGKSCTITVAFVAGPYYTAQTATLTVMDNALGTPQTVMLTALVINPQASLSATSLSFGTQTVNLSATKTVTLKNTGTTALTPISLAVTGTNASDFTPSSNCGSSLAAGNSCTISVAFKSAAKGSRSATLKVTDNAQSGTQTVSLSGTGK